SWLVSRHRAGPGPPGRCGHRRGSAATIRVFVAHSRSVSRHRAGPGPPGHCGHRRGIAATIRVFVAPFVAGQSPPRRPWSARPLRRLPGHHGPHSCIRGPIRGRSVATAPGAPPPTATPTGQVKKRM
ncbi:MAG: hypothetical protein M3Z04_07465, partial [Chloroflexota bacterium]|nr:hypothetical protein [Chloroflexota bacterium]